MLNTEINREKENNAKETKRKNIRDKNRLDVSIYYPIDTYYENLII